MQLNQEQFLQVSRMCVHCMLLCPWGGLASGAHYRTL